MKLAISHPAQSAPLKDKCSTSQDRMTVSRYLTFDAVSVPTFSSTFSWIAKNYIMRRSCPVFKRSIFHCLFTLVYVQLIQTYKVDVPV